MNFDKTIAAASANATLPPCSLGRKNDFRGTDGPRAQRRAILMSKHMAFWKSWSLPKALCVRLSIHGTMCETLTVEDRKIKVLYF